jgi:hypothetical protein
MKNLTKKNKDTAIYIVIAILVIAGYYLNSFWMQTLYCIIAGAVYGIIKYLRNNR